RRRHTRSKRDWSSDVCSSDLKEIVAPNALDGVDVSDVKCLINHDFSYVIGRTQAGTLELQVDGKGLYFKCHLPNTSYARDIYERSEERRVGKESRSSRGRMS